MGERSKDVSGPPVATQTSKVPEEPFDEQLARFGDQMRRFITGAVVYTQTVAERLGINATDLHVLNLLAATGRMTAGALGEATGLTSGAVTHVLDRLEAEGWVQRHTDPDDRRRVVVERMPDPEMFRQLFAPMGKRLAGVLVTMTPAERDAVISFLTACNPLLPEAAVALREQAQQRSAEPGTAACWRPRRGRVF